MPIYLLLSAGCNNDTMLVKEGEQDNDGDGVIQSDDCDDNNPEVGLPTDWYEDADGDGYGNANSALEGLCASEVPAGYVDNSDDCDDADETINPETPWHVDADQDGYGGETTTQSCEQPQGYIAENGDCNDGDAEINPDAPEILCDGIDNDCDGDIDSFEDGVICTSAIGNSLLGTKFIGEASSQAGVSVAATQDSDGNSQVVIGAYTRGGYEYGGAYIVNIDPEVNSYNLANADVILTGENQDDNAGSLVAIAGDPNQDGNPDFLVNAVYNDTTGTNAGAAYLIFSPASSGSLAEMADVIFLGESSYMETGSGLSYAGDVNADGYDDILLGANGSINNSDSGRVYLFHGPVTNNPFFNSADKTLNVSAADAILVGNTNEKAGNAVSHLGDIDGDGFDDIVVAAIYDSTNGTATGAVHIVKGPISNTISLDDSDLKLYGEAGGDHAGIALSSGGDINGDGKSDAVVGAFVANKAYVVDGDFLSETSGSTSLSWASTTLQASSGNAGKSVALAGDLNSDQLNDVLVGAYHDGTNGIDAGAAYLVLTPLDSGTMDLSDADFRIYAKAGNLFGDSAANIDADGDEISDLLIGSRQDNEGGSNAGAVYLILGAELGI